MCLCGSVAQWLGYGVGLATGGRGFNPSRCTVECDLGQVVHTDCTASLVSTLWQFKFKNKKTKTKKQKKTRACEWQTFLSAADGSDSPIDWLQYFQRYVAFKQLPDATALPLLALLMRGPANTWFTTLSDQVQNNYDQLLAAFHAKYDPTPPVCGNGHRISGTEIKNPQNPSKFTSRI